MMMIMILCFSCGFDAFCLFLHHGTLSFVDQPLMIFREEIFNFDLPV